MNEIRWKRCTQSISTEIDDRLVVFGMGSGNYVSLNPSARRIWDALEEPLTEAEIEEMFLQVYDVEPEVCRAAIARTMREMAALKLVSLGN